ncbi:DUF3600 domain-containing protein [Ferdinandcohnia sp. Marseille-Q9671]
MNHNLKQEFESIEIPSEIGERSKLGIKQARIEMDGKIKKYVRKRLMVGALAASLLIPTSTFAYQTLLADELYGSYENVKKHIMGATMEGYLLLDAKLTQAKGDLDKEEYSRFKELVKVVTAAKIDYANLHGHIDYSKIPTEELHEIKEAMLTIQPYFDKLNGLPSSKEILTTSEYEQYIHALMMYEQIMAQSGTDDPEKILPSLQKEFAKANAFLTYVDEKQIGD